MDENFIVFIILLGVMLLLVIGFMMQGTKGEKIHIYGDSYYPSLESRGDGQQEERND